MIGSVHQSDVGPDLQRLRVLELNHRAGRGLTSGVDHSPFYGAGVRILIEILVVLCAERKRQRQGRDNEQNSKDDHAIPTWIRLEESRLHPPAAPLLFLSISAAAQSLSGEPLPYNASPRPALEMQILRGGPKSPSLRES